MPGVAGSNLRLHVVTDDDTLAREDFLRVASALLEAGSEALALHVRGPRTSGRRIHEIADMLAPAAEASRATLMVNDRVDVALAIESVGVHLGRRSLPLDVVRGLLGPERLVGVSCHSVESVRDAVSSGATYVLAGHVFQTPSHPGEQGRGVGWLADAVAAAGETPVAAIGGVRQKDLAAIRATGALGVALLRGVWNSPDPAMAAVEYIHGLNV
jgi:thiamine-phosphate pyrophosphorylase